MPATRDPARAGADLLTQTPEIAAWLRQLDQPLDIFSIAYLDGERHVRVSLAMDAIGQAMAAADPRTTRAWMATPTDVFAVPQALAEAVMQGYEARGALKRLAQAGVRAGSGGRSFVPSIEGLLSSGDGQQWGVVDALVVEQGPNYALAKRLQQWRALVARAEGSVASINVAPSTRTASVLSNAALAAGFRGAKAFDIEVFDPDTTNALMAAMWVHDLRNPAGSAQPQVALAHPLMLLTEGANHGGLWRSPYLPRSVLPFAAMLGLMRRSLNGRRRRCPQASRRRFRPPRAPVRSASRPGPGWPRPSCRRRPAPAALTSAAKLRLAISLRCRQSTSVAVKARCTRPGRTESSRYSSSRRSVNSRSPRTPELLNATVRKCLAAGQARFGQAQQAARRPFAPLRELEVRAAEAIGAEDHVVALVQRR